MADDDKKIEKALGRVLRSTERKKPVGHPGEAKCRAEGAEAARAGKKKTDCPYHPNDQRPQTRAWIIGWEAAAETIVKTAPVTYTHRALLTGGAQPFYVAGDVDVSQPVYRQPLAPPCPNCRCARLASGSQATIVVGIQNRIAWMRCRNCNQPFKAPLT